MSGPRLFLVAPPGISPELLQACTEAAAKTGDCASILVPDSISATATLSLQSLGLAVIIQDCEPRLVHRLGADGIHIGRSAPVAAIRATLKDEAIGVFAATSRHIAMEAAEAGADYIAFAQNSQKDGEPLIGWWHDVSEVPTVAFDPVEAADLTILLPQNPDFIRPPNAMWQSAGSARETVSVLMKAISP